MQAAQFWLFYTSPFGPVQLTMEARMVVRRAFKLEARAQNVSAKVAASNETYSLLAAVGCQT